MAGLRMEKITGQETWVALSCWEQFWLTNGKKEGPRLSDHKALRSARSLNGLEVENTPLLCTHNPPPLLPLSTFKNFRVPRQPWIPDQRAQPWPSKLTACSTVAVNGNDLKPCIVYNHVSLRIRDLVLQSVLSCFLQLGFTSSSFP